MRVWEHHQAAYRGFASRRQWLESLSQEEYMEELRAGPPPCDLNLALIRYSLHQLMGCWAKGLPRKEPQDFLPYPDQPMTEQEIHAVMRGMKKKKKQQKQKHKPVGDKS